MNWYELASAEEVIKVLDKVYRDEWDSETEWVQHWCEDEPVNEWKRPVNYEIAEALWAEEEFNKDL